MGYAFGHQRRSLLRLLPRIDVWYAPAWSRQAQELEGAGPALQRPNAVSHALAFTPEVHVAAVALRGSQGAGAVPRPAVDVVRGGRGPLWSRGPLRAPAAGPRRPPAAVRRSSAAAPRPRVEKWIYRIINKCREDYCCHRIEDY